MKSFSNSPKLHVNCFCILFIFFTCPIAHAQILLEDVDGKDLITTIGASKIAENGINLGINSTDRSLKLFSYLKLDDEIIPQEFLSFRIKGRANNSYSSILTNGEINPGVEIGASYFKRHFFIPISSNKTDWFTAGAALNFSDYSLYDPSEAFENQFSNEKYRGLQLTTTYSLFLAGDRSTKDRLVTLGLNYKKENNANFLQNATIKEFNIVQNENSTLTRELSTERTALVGEYEEFDSFDVKLSLTFLPTEDAQMSDVMLSGFNLFAIRTFNTFQNTLNAGFIYYLTRQNSQSGLRTPVIGLILEAKDLFDEAGQGNTLDQRLVLGITSSFSLNKVLGI